MKLDDALFNWLQIQVVAVARPHDASAQETASFFLEILTNDHHVSEPSYEEDEASYLLSFYMDGQLVTKRYDKENVDSLLVAIDSEPKYNQ